MDKLEYYIKISFSMVATIATIFFGGWDIALQVLIILIVIDYVSGVSSAFCNKKLSSVVGASGIIKKVMILLIIVLAAQIDRIFNNQAQFIRIAVIYFYVANEGISILENLAFIGIPLPPMIKEKLLQIKGDD